MSDSIPNAEEQIPSIEDVFAQLQGKPPEEMVPALAAIVQALVGQMAEFEGTLQKYCADVDRIHSDVFEPIKKSYNDKLRERGIGEIKSKYGSKFDDLQEPLGAFGISDVYGFLYDKLSELQGTEGYTDEMGDSAVMDFHKGAMDRIGKVRGKAAEEPAAPPPAEEPKKGGTAIEVAVTKEPAKSLKEKKMNMRGGY